MIEPIAISAILGLRPARKSLSELALVVRHGLPKRALDHLALSVFSDKREARDFARTLIPLATYKRRTVVLSLAESELLERIARVLAHAEKVWDDRRQAQEWMLKPHIELEKMTPLDMARTELGARRVEDLLDKLVYGLPV
jgi:putative toxin-antitoxin system antitoxin component (TIGR02293 family)